VSSDRGMPQPHCAAPNATAISTATVPVEDIAPSWKLLLTLGVAGAASGLLIAALYTAMQPRIDQYKSNELRSAINEVLETPARSDTLYLHGGTLTATRPDEISLKTDSRIYRGFDASGNAIGYAIEAIGPGFSENMRLLVGYDAARHELKAMKILDSKETPGIADGILKPDFGAQFKHAIVPVVGVKASPKAPDKGTVVMITGATISSRAIIRAINTTLARWDPLISAYETSISGKR
jgi:electron transport complex protein RnfG